MNKQIISLIDAYRRKLPLELTVFIQLFAASAAWLKLSHDNKLDEEQCFSGTGNKAQFEKVLNDCVDVNFSEEIWEIKELELTELLNSINELIKAKVTNFEELSRVIKYLQDDAGKKGGLFSVPEEVTKLGSMLITGNVQSVYCPFSRGSDFAMQWPKSVKKSGESTVQSEVFLSYVHNILLDNNFETVNADPIFLPHYKGDGGLEQFDASIALPPMGMKLQSQDINDIWGRFPEKSLMGEVYFLRHMLAQTSNIVVCFVANGFLFRTAAGEKQFKQDMLSNKWIKAIIALPENLLPSTGLPVSVVVLDKNKTDNNVKFIDASSSVFADKSSRTRNRLTNIDRIIEAYNSNEESDISVDATPEQIIKNDYNLSPNRYVLSNESKEAKEYLRQFQTAKLADLVDIIRPQAVKHTEKGTDYFYEYNLSSLNEANFVVGEGKEIKVSHNDVVKASKQTIQFNDVLVVCKGAVGKIGFVGDEINHNAIASQAFAVLRIKPHVDAITPEALYQFLTSKYGQQLLTELTTGTSALMLSAKDLNTLKVPLYSVEKLNKIKEIRQSVINTFQQIEDLKSDIKRLNESWL